MGAPMAEPRWGGLEALLRSRLPRGELDPALCAVLDAASPGLAIGVGGAYAPNDPAVQAVHFRMGDVYGAHANATGSGPFSATASGLRKGLNYVSLFAQDAMAGTSGSGKYGNGGATPTVTGAPRVFDGKVVIGSMNRGGLAGTSFELDDRFTGYDAAAIERMGWQGGKMLLRIDPDDVLTARTLESCAAAVNGLADRGLLAMVEPFIAHRVDGRVRNDLSTAAVIRSATVAAGLGWTSAHTWLKLPVIEEMQPVLAATNLPVLLLGGEVSADQDAQFALWEKVLASPQVRGMVVGRTLLYPPDGDVAAAVDSVVRMLA